LTLTATAPPAVLASGGTTSGSTTHGIGARPILKDRAKAKTDVADRARLCVFRPMPSRRAVRLVPKDDISSRRFEVNDWE
jgi:hypothetical protein